MAGKTRAVARPVRPRSASGSVLDKNLASMSVVSQRARSPNPEPNRPRMDRRRRRAHLMHPDRRLGTQDGPASRKRPGEEARRLAETVDIDKAGVVVVKGFGCGHHVRALLERGKTALIVVFEPDVAAVALRARAADFSAGSATRSSRLSPTPTTRP